MTTGQKKFINCHTHIFTGDHVPPWLAKTFLPFGLYHLANLRWIVALFRWWYKGPVRWTKHYRYKNIIRALYATRVIILRNVIFNSIRWLLGGALTVQVVYFTFRFCHTRHIVFPDLWGIIAFCLGWLETHLLLLVNLNGPQRLSMLIMLFIFFKPGRNVILFIIKSLVGFLKIASGKRTLELIGRYLSIGRFAFYEGQSQIFQQLTGQYQPGTGFVVLPMDMTYMSAGRLSGRSNYRSQMNEIEKMLKSEKTGDIIYPFVFIDPRRIEPGKGESIDPESEGKAFFDWELTGDGQVILKECLVKSWIEEKGFRGFKIYPALGYYPFDTRLLPLWKYAADNGIPITTHCIRGTIFYRGRKRKEWDAHPVYNEGNGKSLLLPEEKAIEFSANFTHPMNYLCLLEPELLAKVLTTAPSKIQEIFGWSNGDTTTGKRPSVKRDLKDLKVCLAHFGGDDEWGKFFDRDRDQYAKMLVTNPDRGISFFHNSKGEFSDSKLEQLWRNTDWYSIICSMMLQYPKLYADVSYIIHNEQIYPLLKQTLRNGQLRQRVLFGTDFYVVRNHKSEKCMVAETLAEFCADDIDALAFANPRSFLNTRIHKDID